MVAWANPNIFIVALRRRSALNHQQGIWPPPRSGYVALLAVAVLSLALIEITDVIELPLEPQLAAITGSSVISASSLTSAMKSLGYAGLFALMALESASAPIPSEIVLPFAGYLVFRGSMNFALAVLVSTAAGVVGALADFYLAFLVGRPLFNELLSKVGVRPSSIARAEKWMNERGSWSVFLARFVPGLRSIISFPAGLFEMKVRTFVVLTCLGCLIWSAALIYLGYSAGSLWDAALARPSSAFSVIDTFAAMMSCGYLVYYLLGNRFHR